MGCSDDIHQIDRSELHLSDGTCTEVLVPGASESAILSVLHH